MKKRIILAVFACAALLTACGNTTEPASSVSENSDASAAPEAEESFSEESEEFSAEEELQEAEPAKRYYDGYEEWAENCADTELPVISDYQSVIDSLNPEKVIKIDAVCNDGLSEGSVQIVHFWTDPYYMYYDPAACESYDLKQSLATMYINNSDQNVCIETCDPGDESMSHKVLLPAHCASGEFDPNASLSDYAVMNMKTKQWAASVLTEEHYLLASVWGNENFLRYADTAEEQMAIFKNQCDLQFQFRIKDRFGSVVTADGKEYCEKCGSNYGFRYVIYFLNDTELVDTAKDLFECHERNDYIYEQDMIYTGYGRANRVLILPIAKTALCD